MGGAPCALALLIALSACGDDGVGDEDAGPGEDAAVEDAGPDAGPIERPVFDAEPDPDVLTGCLADAPAEGSTRAKRVECPEERSAGTVAMAQEGDILLENAVAKVVIRAATLESLTTIGAYGGGILDAAPQGGADVLKEIFFGLDLNAARATDVQIIDAGGPGEPARVRVLYELDELGLIAAVLGSGVARVPPGYGAIDYELAPDEPVLRVRIRLAAAEGPRVVGRPSMVALVGGGAELMQPGVGVLGDSPGASGRPVLVGEGAGEAFALGIDQPEGSVNAINSILILQGEERVIAAAGEVAEWEAQLALGTRAAEAYGAVAREDEAELLVEGAAGDRVEVRSGDAVWLRTRLDAAGQARVRVPAGAVEARPGFGPFVAPSGVEGTAPGELSVEPLPRTTLAITATAEGASAPIRATVGGSGGELRREIVFGETRFDVPAGGMGTVTLSRGMEHDIHVEEVMLEAGEEVAVSADLARVVDTSGWVAGDFHLHTEMSTDSRHRLTDAVRVLAGEGLEVVAATDHDVVSDYGPAIAAEGLDDWLVAVSGAEVSDPILAHINGYPVQRDTSAPGFGSPVWFGRAPMRTFDALRAMEGPLGPPLVQVNHPNRDSSGWFRSIALDPVTGLVGASPEDLGLEDGADLMDFDFDVIEAFNRSLSEADEDTLDQLLALWRDGWRFAMAGNSDSHRDTAPAGSPRTYVAVDDDTPGEWGWADVAAGMRAGRTSVGAGIFVTATPGAVTGDSVALEVRVQAAPWVEVDRLRVYAGTEVVVDREVEASADVDRVNEVIDVPLGGADFVLVRASGARAQRPALPFEPFGVTSPIEVR
ncbi:MAG: hypothetical protein CMN29_04290 [Sandaracinus sp.]|nr:hypothetical protein [Sandaracinus sp.]